MGLIPKHGGYRSLISYRTTEIIYDLTVDFCKKFIDFKSRTVDQMVQAARSGKQNIVEGTMASGTSKKTEMKLIGVARASLEELLQDYEDFLRQQRLALWEKADPRVSEIRHMSYTTNRSYMTYMSFLSEPEKAANCAICLIHQANYLLDRQLRSLEKSFWRRVVLQKHYTGLEVGEANIISEVGHFGSVRYLHKRGRNLENCGH
jgi:four helix bundle protein